MQNHDLTHQRARVLCLDDDPNVLAIVSALLGASGFIVEVCSDASTCEAHAARFAPHALLVDVSVVSDSAPGLIGALRSRGAPVVLFSALEERRLAALAEQLGATGYLSKQDPTKLVARLEELLRSHRSQSEREPAMPSRSDEVGTTWREVRARRSRGHE